MRRVIWRGRCKFVLQGFYRKYQSMRCSLSLSSKKKPNNTGRTKFEYQIFPAFEEIAERNIVHVATGVR